MNTSNYGGLSTLLCLPAPDVRALGSGRSICAITALFVRPGQKFLLCPLEILDSSDRLEWCYRPAFHFDAKIALDALEHNLPEICFWATCEKSIIIDDSERIKSLEGVSIWQKDWLASKINTNKIIFVTILRVYKLRVSLRLPASINYQERVGKFLSIQESHTQAHSSPVLSDALFIKRKQQLEEFSSPEYPELEILQSQINELIFKNPDIERFHDDLRTFLEWQNPIPTPRSSPDWFKKISSYGYRTNEDVENRKSNYKAGTDFEIIIRESLEFLGFTVDEAHIGGAGGIDIFCSHPYDLVGECKCGKGIPDNTVEQLNRIAKRHLKERYEGANRFIIGPGQPSLQLLESAKLPTTSIMKPETLQKLVEFHNQYPINLFELRDKCLVAGQVDDRITSFLEELTSRVKLRSHIIRTLRRYLQDYGLKDIGLKEFKGVFNVSHPPQVLTDRELYDILIELSSPLTGYLGRTKGATWENDLFYFLRDLSV